MDNRTYEEQGPIDDGWWSAIMESEEDLSSNSIEGISDQSSVQLPKSVQVNGKDIEIDQDVDWGMIADLYQREQVLECEVVACNRGGVLVSCDGFQGFVPISHLVKVTEVPENQRENVLEKYIGQIILAKVIECEESRGRIVLSERAAKAAPGQRQKLFTDLSSDSRLTGAVTNITKFGVFVDLGGVEGLAHISELSWGRVTDPKRLFQVGEEIEVLVLNVDRSRGRVSLSVKRLLENPWEFALERYPNGERVLVTITDVVPYGAFARLEQGLEGLIHISEMGLDEGVRPEEILQKDEQVWVSVLSVEPENQRLSLRLEI